MSGRRSRILPLPLTCSPARLGFSTASSDLPNRNMSPMWRYNCSDKSGNLCVLSRWWPIDLIQMGMDEAAYRAAAAWPHPHLFSLRSHNNLGGWRESGWPLYRFCEVCRCFFLHFLHFWPADPCKQKFGRFSHKSLACARLTCRQPRVHFNHLSVISLPSNCLCSFPSVKVRSPFSSH